jgi:hypothetical protein
MSQVWIKEIVTFLYSERDIGSFLLCGQDAATCNFSQNSAVVETTAGLR